VISECCDVQRTTTEHEASRRLKTEFLLQVDTRGACAAVTAGRACMLHRACARSCADQTDHTACAPLHGMTDRTSLIPLLRAQSFSRSICICIGNSAQLDGIATNANERLLLVAATNRHVCLV
jgi:hypothetical protein